MAAKLSDGSIRLIFKCLDQDLDYKTIQKFRIICSNVNKVAVCHNMHKINARLIRIQQVYGTNSDDDRIGFQIRNMSSVPGFINMEWKHYDPGEVRYIHELCLCDINLSDYLLDSISQMFIDNKIIVYKLNIRDCQFPTMENCFARFISIVKPISVLIMGKCEPDFYLLKHSSTSVDENRPTVPHNAEDFAENQLIHPIYVPTGEICLHNKANGRFRGWNKMSCIDDNLVEHWIKNCPDMGLYIGGTVPVTFKTLWKRFELSNELPIYEDLGKKYWLYKQQPVSWRFHNISSSKDTLKQITEAQRDKTYTWYTIIRKYYTFYRVESNRRKLCFRIHRPNLSMTTEEYEIEVARVFEVLDQAPHWTEELVFMLKDLTDMVPPEKCGHLMPEFDARITDMIQGWYYARGFFHEDD